MSQKFTFEQYRTIFEEAIKKYEGDDFFANLIKSSGRPVFPAAPLNCAIIGIRHEGKEMKFRENIADDTVTLVRINSDGESEVWEYVGATESGVFDKVYNADGDFKMSPGFSYFTHGKHGKKQHPCLVQACEVVGERAKKGTAFNETDDKRWTLGSSIHIHAGINRDGTVGEWSAGCTVIGGGWDGNAWKQFLKYVQKANNLPIPYVLVNESDIPEFLAAQAAGPNGSNGNGASVAAAAAAPSPAKDNGGEFSVPERSDVEDILLTARPATTRFNHEVFWENYRKGLKVLGERVRAEEVEHVENILTRASGDARIQNLAQLAYMMATARWETDRFTALFERGGDAYLRQYQGRGGNTRTGDYKNYRGTGYVHLTFRDNFRKAGRLLGAPLEEHPALAADQHWAYEVMVRGSLEGWFTGKKLGDYVNDSEKDFRNARRVINPGELDIAERARAIPRGSRTERQRQCVDALDKQTSWAAMIEGCLKAAEAAASPVPEPEQPNAGDPDASEGKLVPPPAPEDIAVGPATDGGGTQPSTQPAPQPGVVQASTGSVKRRNATLLGGAAAAVAAAKGWVIDNPMLSAVITIAFLAAVIWLVTWYIHVQRDLDKKRMDIASDPGNNKVR